MKKERNLVLGSFEEIIGEIACHLKSTAIPQKRFKGVDFSVIEGKPPEDEALSVINSTPLFRFGIKQINSGFDNDSLELFSDYYGGGCGAYGLFEKGESLETIKADLREMLNTTLSRAHDELVDTDKITIEWLGVAEMRIETSIVMSYEEIKRNLPYAFICTIRESSVWNTIRRKRAWDKEFTVNEKNRAYKIFKQAREWYLIKGVPDEVKVTPKDYEMWMKLEEFCARIS